MDINGLYKHIMKEVDPNVTEKEKWNTCLQSKDEKMVQNTMYCAQQLLQKGEGLNIFKELLYSDNEAVVQNTMHLLCNFATNQVIVEQVKANGFVTLLQAFQKTSPPKNMYLLHFIANLLVAGQNDASFSSKFIDDGGLACVINVLTATTTTPQMSNLALMIFSNIVASKQKTRDYAVFATTANFEAFSQILKSTNQNSNAIKMVLSIIANLVNDESNRTLFYDSKALPSILDFLRNNQELQEVVITLIANVLHKVEVANELVDSNGIPPIVSCLDSNNARAVSSSISAINTLSVVGEEVAEKAVPVFVETKAFNKLLRHTRGTRDLKLKAAKALSNLMGIEAAQIPLKEAGAIEAVLEIARTEKDEEIKLKALKALFHMTMFNDAMRNSVLEAGLSDLTTILTSPTQSLPTKKEVAKSMVNMALGGDAQKFSEQKTIPGLITVLSKSGDEEAEEITCMALENLAINQGLNDEIARHGGVEASIEFLKRAKSKNNVKTKERSAKLISRLAINSKNRKKMQESNVSELLQDFKSEGDSSLSNAVLLAFNNVNAPIFETQEKVPESAFPELAPYKLESDEEATEEESESDANELDQQKKENKVNETQSKVMVSKPNLLTDKKKPVTSEKPPPPPDVDPEKLRLAKLDVKRTKVAYELLSTESTYCKNLQIIIQKFQNPLLQMARSKKTLIAVKDIRTIFGSVEIIYGYNSMLLDSLNQRMSKWGSNQIVGDIFLYMGDCFKVYTDYINNYALSQQTLQHCSEDNPKFKKWLDTTSQLDFCSGLTLISFLILPVQRLPRYSLLLRELKKSTPDDHPDVEALEKAIEKIDYVNNYLNLKKKETESQFKIIELVERLGGDVNLLLPMRQFELQSEVWWTTESAIPNPNKIRGYMVIFTDSILFTRFLKKKEKVVKFIDAQDVKLVQEESKGEKLVLLFDENDKRKTKTRVDFYFSKSAEAQLVKTVLSRSGIGNV